MSDHGKKVLKSALKVYSIELLSDFVRELFKINAISPEFTTESVELISKFIDEREGQYDE